MSTTLWDGIERDTAGVPVNQSVTVSNNYGGWGQTYTLCTCCNSAPCCCSSSSYYIQTWPYPSSKIRLTLSEIEHLRKAAKKDAELRASLEKFRHLIEIEVDFDG